MLCHGVSLVRAHKYLIQMKQLVRCALGIVQPIRKFFFFFFFYMNSSILSSQSAFVPSHNSKTEARHRLWETDGQFP